jgi:serpin B
MIFLCIFLLLTSFGCGQVLEQAEPINLRVNESLISANKTFSFDMLRMLDQEEGEQNLFFSPLSISMVLSMAVNGARGETRDEMMQAMSYQNLQVEEINEDYADYQRYLAQEQGRSELLINNSIWIREGQDLNKEYLDLMSNDYMAMSDFLNFADPEAADIINDWIEDATNGRIKEMLTPPLPEDAILYLVNAIYFKGDWEEQFDDDQTFATKFHGQSGDSTVQMMSEKRTAWYMEDESLQAVRLPYEDEKRSMIILLPKDNKDIENLIEKLDVEMFEAVSEGFWEAEDLILQIPKFEMEYGAKNLNQALKNLGMKTAFTGDADLSGIGEGLFISRVLHKAFIEVNEKGSEAAAVTVGEEACEELAEPLRFRADRPFLFLIYDEEAESILFLGKYCE